jgi:tetratricopeptide (TPR) repeat protein
MSYLLEILGRGLLAELSAAFRDVIADDGHFSTAELRTAYQRTTGTSDPAVRFGARCLANREYAPARAAFETALAIEPDSLAARVGLACVCDELGRIGEALQHLAAASQHHPEEPTVLFALGFCHERWGKTDQAAVDYRRCLEAAPNLRNARERLAAIHLKQNDLKGAIDQYEQICWYDPGEIVPALTLANLYLQAGRHEDAIRRFQHVLTIEPDNWEACDDLVAAYEQAGMHLEAIDQLRHMMAEQPDFPDNHLRLGDLYAKLGDEAGALTEYEAAAELNPDYLEAAVKVGTSHLRGGRHLEAARWFSRAVEINDRLLTAYVGLGVAQHELGQIDEALASFEMAASVEPNTTLLSSETARLHLKMGVNRQVERYLSPASMARVRNQEGCEPVEDLIDRQIQRHQAAVEARPNYADLHYRLGLLLKHRGDVEEAIKCFRTATSINPTYIKALIQLGLSLHAIGRSDEGTRALSRALAVDPESVELHYQLGLMFTDRQQFTLAVEQFERAMETEPRNIDLHANLALALQNIGMIDRAAGAWHTLCDLAQQTETRQETISQIRRDERPGP